MDSVLKPPDILANAFSTNAGVHLDVEVVTNSQHNPLRLRSKLPSGGEYQSLHPVEASKLGLY